MKTLSLSVSWHPASGQFVKYVGYATGRDGTPKPKSFYLGDDQPTALATAARLVGDWAALKASGAKVWPQTYLDDLQRTRTAGIATVGKLANGLTPDETIKGLTVAECRDGYLAEHRERMEGRQMTRETYQSLSDRTRVALERLPSNLQIIDRPIRTLGESDLRKVILYWTALPVGKVANQAKRPTTGEWVGYKWRKNQPKRTKRSEGKRIGPVYARELVLHLKAFLNWCHETERWDKPRRFDRLFKLKFNIERGEPEKFTVDELGKLYAACKSDRHRLWIMLGLNCGFDRTGLATLEWSMVKGLDTDCVTIERPRHKTKVYSRHVLWDETVRLLRAVKTVGARGLVCLTERGEPLIDFQRDGVHAAWRHLTVNAGVRHLSYGKLRKTGAWMTKRIGGLEVSEMYLAHVERGMNKHYAGRDWDKLDAALKIMRVEIGPMLQNVEECVPDAA